MSKSKASNKYKNYDDAKAKLIKLVVDFTESEFLVEKQNDDGGVHLMIYLPESARKNFNTFNFYNAVDESLGRVRKMLCFVPDGYIENFLRNR
jgi:hypothetical protein